jgi:lysophospholipase L1-like esterase
MVIIMLGTNELKSAFNLSAVDIALGITKLAETVLAFETDLPEVLLVAPPHVTEDVYAASQEFSGAVEKSRDVAGYLEKMASDLCCFFFDASTVAKVDPADGLHLGKEGHAALAAALSEKVRRIFEERDLDLEALHDE